ncbi:MAG TPA: arylsulfatase, partial [Agriterribacter sp.]|nr:arylsulfatase [Agriterribacter sp.]
MKSLFYALFMVLLGSAACRESANNLKAGSHRPNVLLIMTDDQGYGDLGFTGNVYIQTPHLDQLAKESAWFTNFYVSPVCAPTRSSIMTGKFSLRTGIYDTFNGGAMMNTHETTIAELLRDNGYRTAIFGKWHLGDAYPFRPGDQGFEESLIHRGGGIGQVGDPSNFYRNDSSYFDPVLFHNNKKIKTKGYCSDVFTDGVLSFIEQKSDDPFFVYLAFNAPHTPLQVPQEWYDKYKNLRFDSAEARQRGMLLLPMNDAEKENARRVYGMVSNIDDNVGRIMEALRKNGKLDNTLVIFLSDNGPQNKRYNYGLRALKGDTYEGGVKSPCLLRFPKLFKPGSTIPAVAAHIDLLPTIADLCGTPLPNTMNIDG